MENTRPAFPPLPETDIFEIQMEARSALRLRRELPLDFHYTLIPDRSIELHIETEYDAQGLWPHPILLVRARTTGRDLAEAGNFAVGFVRSLFIFYAVAMNCYIEEAQVTYAFDASTKPAGARSFLQSQSNIVRQRVPSETRLIAYEAATSFAQLALGAEPKIKERLARASQQYVLALQYWNLEQRVLAGGHAFMAAEALTPVAKRSLGKTDEELAQLEIADRFMTYTKRRRDVSNGADVRARRSVTFHGDSGTLKGAADLSNGLEHGYGEYDSPPCQDELVPAFLETLCTRGAGKDGTTWRRNLVLVTA